MTKVKVFVNGRRQQQQRQRRGYDNSSPDFCHGELKMSVSCVKLEIIVVNEEFCQKFQV